MQSNPHRIRLRGPWECEPVARSVRCADGSIQQVTHDLPPAGKVRVPGDWSEALGSGFRGRVCFRRRFHRPTGLESHERLSLVIEGVEPAGDVRLNGQNLGRVTGMSEKAVFDVTELVESQNELVIEVTLEESPRDVHAQQRGGNAKTLDAGRVGEVRLEIESARS